MRSRTIRSIASVGRGHERPVGLAPDLETLAAEDVEPRSPRRRRPARARRRAPRLVHARRAYPRRGRMQGFRVAWAHPCRPPSNAPPITPSSSRSRFPPSRFAKDLDRTYRAIAREVKIPGFRPGKAPEADHRRPGRARRRCWTSSCRPSVPDVLPRRRDRRGPGADRRARRRRRAAGAGQALHLHGHRRGPAAPGVHRGRVHGRRGRRARRSRSTEDDVDAVDRAPPAAVRRARAGGAAGRRRATSSPRTSPATRDGEPLEAAHPRGLPLLRRVGRVRRGASTRSSPARSPATSSSSSGRAPRAVRRGAGGGAAVVPGRS